MYTEKVEVGGRGDVVVMGIPCPVLLSLQEGCGYGLHSPKQPTFSHRRCG